MSAIAGVAKSGKSQLVKKMLGKMSHRGSACQYILDDEQATLGVACSETQDDTAHLLKTQKIARDGHGTMPATQVRITKEGIVLSRDPLGIDPLYYGWTDTGILCFASEIKALLLATRDINELLPGHRFRVSRLETYYKLDQQQPIEQRPEIIVSELRSKLEQSVTNLLRKGETAAWLSGGLDSSAMVALARPHLPQLHTFTAGLLGSPDLEYSRIVAEHIQTNHHELVVDFNDLLAILPEVIYHLESFDALLVRSSMMNYLVAKEASDYAPLVLSGEGSDELFAGYSYLKALSLDSLSEELVDITGRLHNTALQRVDRCASAHGTQASLGFLDPEVVSYALRIPVEYKIHEGTDKWVLRLAIEDLLPSEIIYRPKAKFWEGAGVSDLIAAYSEDQVSDSDFVQHRNLPNQWRLNTKEEMMYYQIFCDCFGKLEDYSWMGRTKGAPQNQ